MIRLWWLSQWLVTYGHHLAVTIYLHVVPSTDRHRAVEIIVFKIFFVLFLRLWYFTDVYGQQFIIRALAKRTGK